MLGLQVTDRRGETTDFEYDDLGYLESTELPEISVDGQNVRPKMAQQSLALTIGPDSTSGDGTSSSPATPVGLANARAWIEDALGNRTYFTLDEFGAPELIEEPLGRTTEITRNSHSQVTRVDRPSGAHSTTSWSGPWVTSSHESTTGHTVWYEYDTPPGNDFEHVIRVHDNQSNREVWYEYDDDLLEAAYFDTIGGPLLASYTYNGNGQLNSETDSETGHLVEYDYDGSLAYANVRKISRIRGSDTLVTIIDSDDYGRRVKTVNPAGDSTFVSYDDLDRMQWSVNALGDTTHFDYDAYLPDKVTDAEGQIYETTHNALGWATTTYDPAGDSTVVGYEENGNVISATDRLGNEASFGYDSLNLPSFEEVEGETTHLWTDPDGLKTAAWNDVSADTTIFDTSGRPVKQIVRRGSNLSRRYVIRSSYEDDGPRKRLWISTPGSIDYDMRYTWTNQGQLQKLSDHVPSTPVHTEFGYNSHHQLDEVDIGGGTRWEYDYSDFHPVGNVEYPTGSMDDAFGYGVNLDTLLLRVSELNWAGGDTVRTIDYDPAGQVEAFVDSAFIGPTCGWHERHGEYCYGGTALGEVRQASFAYDDVGNRTDSGADTDPGNRLTDFGSYTFTFDDEGRTKTKSKTGFSQTYHWNDRSQVDSVTTIDSGDTTVVRYTYDGLGRRITRDGPGGFEEYLYDGDHVIAVLDDNQNVLRTFSYYPGVDKPHSVMTDSTTYYYATDPTGSVIGLAEYDGAPSVVNHYRYDVWGMPQGNETEGAENPLRFKARWWDEDTELLDFRSRWYDPEIGRFISEDPIGLAGGINVYRFAGNNPVHGWDPYGLANQETPPSHTGPPGCAAYVYSPTGYTGCRLYDLDPLIVAVSEPGMAFDPWYIGPGPDYATGPGTGRAPAKAAGSGSPGSGGQDTEADDGPTGPDDEGSFEQCFNRWRLSSVASYYGGESAGTAVKAFELSALVSNAGDVVATWRKTRRGPVLGSQTRGASGFNMVARRVARTIGKPNLIPALTTIGNKITTGGWTITLGAAAYNGTTALQCGLGVLE